MGGILRGPQDQGPVACGGLLRRCTGLVLHGQPVPVPATCCRWGICAPAWLLAHTSAGQAKGICNSPGPIKRIPCRICSLQACPPNSHLLHCEGLAWISELLAAFAIVALLGYQPGFLLFGTTLYFHIVLPQRVGLFCELEPYGFGAVKPLFPCRGGNGKGKH